MIFSCEGGPRAGKTLMITYLAARAHIHGLKVYTNYPLYFPANRWGMVPKILPIEKVVNRHGKQLFYEKSCFHGRQEFYTEVESRSMGNMDFRYGVLDWLMQIGKDRSSLAADAQDLDSLDKRFRVGILTERIWAMSPFHHKGSDFRFGFYDRPTMQGQVRVIREAEISWLYRYYDTYARSYRPDAAHK